MIKITRVMDGTNEKQEWAEVSDSDEKGNVKLRVGQGDATEGELLINSSLAYLLLQALKASFGTGLQF